MNQAKPSLLERAAEIYDFASGFPMEPARPLPPPDRPRVAPKPVEATPVQRTPIERAEPEPRRPMPRPVARSAAHKQVSVDPDVMAAAGLLVPDRPGGNLAEEMRLLKRRLLGAIEARVERGDETARIVLVASGKPGEGKTFMALNLALSIAGERDHNVLLIDGDNAKPELLSRLGVGEESPGLLDALADPAIDPESLVLDTDVEGLALLAPGRRERRAPELLASVRTRDVLESLIAADPRRIVLIDSSPALAASSAVALAEHVGQALVVVKADATSEAELKETLDLLSPCEHLSLVLNNAAFQVGRRAKGKYEEYH